MKIFSFCLYGTDRNYYEGLLENIRIIKEFYPDYEIFVYKGVCPADWTLSGVNVIYTEREGPINMLYRYLPLKFADIGFVRDADSRITERDRWCIDAFLQSDYNYHIIRDHVWHKSKIMGGLFGWKTPLNVDFDVSGTATYGHDEGVLAGVVYPLVVSSALVHTNVFAFHEEHSERIACPQKDVFDFVGNVVWNGAPKFAYSFDVVGHLDTLRAQDQFAIIKYLTDDYNPMSVPYHNRTAFYDVCYTANYYLNDIAKAQYWLSQFEFAEITSHVYFNSQFLLRKLGKRIVATCDPTYKADDDDVVVCYGNYPDWHKALPCSRVLYRHISKFYETGHDVVDYHPAWEPVDTIYILNLEERADRYYDTLLALANVKAPLHRVHHYKAKKDDTPAYIGATQNHVDCIQNFRQSGKSVALVLEDDFVFTDDRERVWSTLNDFWASTVEYTLCFLSVSKHGERQPYNDLLSITKQPCTTSSGYFIRKETVEKVAATVQEGLRFMKETGDHHTFCIDRYWTKLSNLFFFKTKLGFQRPSYSNLIRSVSAHLD